MEKNIVISGVKYTYALSRKSKNKLHLRVSSDGTLSVSAPKSTPIYEIEQFIRSNEEFIIKSLKKLAEGPEKQCIKDGGTVYIFGERYPVRVLEANRSCAGVKNGVFCILVRDASDLSLAEREGEKYLRELCRSVMEKYTYRVYPYFRARGKPLPELRYRKMRSCWGNCRPESGIVTYNTALIGVPEECMEYVAAHELTHLLHPDHSPEFYAELANVIPDWKRRRERLKEYGRAIIE